jgi:hypothetical protein
MKFWISSTEERIQYHRGRPKSNSQEIHHDFILDAEVKTIEVYSYLVNEQKLDRELTWDVTTLYDLESTEEASSHPERSEPDGYRARAKTETEEART